MKINIYIPAIVVVVFTAAVIWSCAEADPRPLRSDTDIETIYTHKNPTQEGWPGTVDNEANTILFTIPTIQKDSVDLTKMYVWVTSGPVDAFYSPKLGQVDISKPWDLTVTGGDGSRKTYSVDYRFYDGIVPVVDSIRIAQYEGDKGWKGVIDNNDNTIVFQVPSADWASLDLTQMYLWIEGGTPLASYSVDKEVVDISSPFELMVTSADGFERVYTVSARFYDGKKPVITDSYAYSDNSGPGWANTVDNVENTIIFNIPTAQYGNFNFTNYYFFIDVGANNHGTYGTPTYSPVSGYFNMDYRSGQTFDLTVTAEDGTPNVYSVLGARYYDGKEASLPYSYIYHTDEGIGYFDRRVNEFEGKKTITYLLNSSLVGNYKLDKVYWFIERDDAGYNHGTFVPPGETGWPKITPENGWKDFTKPWDLTIEAWDGTKVVYEVLGIEFGDNY